MNSWRSHLAAAPGAEPSLRNGEMTNGMDQAAGLRRMSNPKPVKVIAVSSGKGGVGKSSVSVNLAVALANAGNRVLLMDADLGLANVDVLLGLSPRYNLGHVLDGEAELEEILIEGPGGIRIIPASSGTKRMAELGPAENAGLIRSFSELSGDWDYLVIDTAAGIADSTVSSPIAGSLSAASPPIPARMPNATATTIHFAARINSQ